MNPTDIKIGDKFFIFDRNYRNYTRPDGSKSLGPIYRDHFREVTIDGETSRSWVIRFGQKVPKKDPFSVILTSEMVDDRVWENSHRYQISNKVNSPWVTVEDLKRIAKIIGYEEGKS